MFQEHDNATRPTGPGQFLDSARGNLAWLQIALKLQMKAEPTECPSHLNLWIKILTKLFSSWTQHWAKSFGELTALANSSLITKAVTDTSFKQCQHQTLGSHRFCWFVYFSALLMKWGPPACTCYSRTFSGVSHTVAGTPFQWTRIWGTRVPFAVCTSLYFNIEAQAWLSSAAGMGTTDAGRTDHSFASTDDILVKLEGL